MQQWMKIPLWLVCCLAATGGLFAQQNSVRVVVENDSIIMGQPLHYALQYDGSEPNEIIFPEYTDTIARNVYIIKAEDPVKSKKAGEPLYVRNLRLTSFDTGQVVIPGQQIKVIFGKDTLFYYTDSVSLNVLPYLDMDTVPRDTVKAQNAGIVVFGRNNFQEEVAQAIPDSVTQGMSPENLKKMQDSVRNLMIQQFASELYRSIGFRNDDALSLIAAGAKQSLFILANNEIMETYRIPGANDTVFVQEYDTVAKGQNLFVTIQIKDIDDELFNTPLTWAEFWWRFWKFIKDNWWWLLLILAAVVGVLYYLFFRKKNIRQLFRTVPPPEPPHIVALRELSRIRDEKKWQSGKLLDFYSELTETLRKYFEGRFGVSAMEMTTDEIMQHMAGNSSFSQRHLDLLRQILNIADAVKFAKAEPMFHENDSCLKNAFTIVEETIELPDPEAGKQVEALIEVEPENTEEDKSHV